MDPYEIATAGPSNHNVNICDTSNAGELNLLDFHIPGEDMVVAGVSAMSVDGCRIVTTTCCSEMVYCIIVTFLYKASFC
jgi:hypothetical protein